MSVILFPGIKCHDVSSFTCLTCTLVFFVSIPRLTSHPSHCVRVCCVCFCLSVCVWLSMFAFSVKCNTCTHQCFRSDEYCFCLCEHTNFFFLYYYSFLARCCFVPSPSRYTENVVCLYRSRRCILYAMCGEELQKSCNRNDLAEKKEKK